jgi:hypothetical protein
MTYLDSKRTGWSSPVSETPVGSPLFDSAQATRGVQLSLYDEDKDEDMLIEAPPRMSYGNL